MNIDLISFLNKIKTAGVMLWIEGKNIRINGPSNILSPEIVEILKFHKKEIFQILQPDDNCKCCKFAEHINHIGTGCVNKMHGEWDEQWTAVDKLDNCPLGFWN